MTGGGARVPRCVSRHISAVAADDRSTVAWVMIKATSGLLHWNYFIALERDLEEVSRYIEFTKRNFPTYSIELAHLLFAAASEVDVVAKLICEKVAPSKRAGNIDQYRRVLMKELPEIPLIEISVPRYGLKFNPWENWGKSTTPDWWHSYNNVKHQRDAFFHEATLQNALNALGALLAFTYIYYSYELADEPGIRLNPEETTRKLQPDSTLLRLPQGAGLFNVRIRPGGDDPPYT